MGSIISTEKAPKAIGPYSQAVRAGSLLFISGQLPIDPASGQIPASAAAQTERSLQNVKAILEAAGMTMADVVKVNVFMADLSDFGTMNEVYGRYFSAPFPARAAVEVSRLPKDALVEIEAVACKA